MSDATAPVYVIKTFVPPSARVLLRKVLCGGAVLMGVLAFVVPALIGSEDFLITYVFLAAAFLELGMAFVLPGVLGRAPAPVSWMLYADRMDIRVGHKSYGAVPYAAIDRIEDLELPATLDREAGFGGMQVFLREHIAGLEKFPHYDRGQTPALKLRGLKQENHDLARLKELAGKR